MSKIKSNWTAGTKKRKRPELASRLKKGEGRREREEEEKGKDWDPSQ